MYPNAVDLEGYWCFSFIEDKNIVVASKPRHPLDTQTLKKHLLGYPDFIVKNFLKCQSQEYNQSFSSPYYSHDIV